MAHQLDSKKYKIYGVLKIVSSLKTAFLKKYQKNKNCFDFRQTKIALNLSKSKISQTIITI
jgi:hypothetical protein